MKALFINVGLLLLFGCSPKQKESEPPKKTVEEYLQIASKETMPIIQSC
jgi:hypothetical protein